MADKDRVVQGYARALFAVAEAEGELDRVEDELYRFEVRLSSPLRGRELLDGACALPGYVDEPDCRSSARAE